MEKDLQLKNSEISDDEVPEMTTRQSTVTLAQVLFEASPTRSWRGAWDMLGPEQIAWWNTYAEIAREHLRRESDFERNVRHNPSDSEPSPK